MDRLTRDVRFNLVPGRPFEAGQNGHAGMPATDRPAVHWVVRVTVSGDLEASGYLLDIKKVDEAVRDLLGPVLADAVTAGRPLPGVAGDAFARLSAAWPDKRLERLELVASPFQSVAVGLSAGVTMTQLSQHFEFSAAHRLHDSRFGDDENRRLFGKCNNPQGHGHNYEVRVTVAGTPGEDGRLVDVAGLERLVEAHAIGKVDHKHLNLQVPEFAALNPSVENIARVIYTYLKPHLVWPNARLKSVTVWETPKTSCEYEEA